MGSVKRQRLEQRIGEGTDMGSETHQRRGKRTRSKIDATRFKRIRRKISKKKGSKRGANKLRKRPRTPRRKRQRKEQRGNRDKVDPFLATLVALHFTPLSK